MPGAVVKLICAAVGSKPTTLSSLSTELSATMALRIRSWPPARITELAWPRIEADPRFRTSALMFTVTGSAM